MMKQDERNVGGGEKRLGKKCLLCCIDFDAKGEKKKNQTSEVGRRSSRSGEGARRCPALALT